MRAVLTVALAVLVVLSYEHDVPVALVVALTSVALATDAVDGQVARRTGTVESLRRPLRHGDRRRAAAGAQHVRRPSTSALWVLAIGLARYVFLAAKVPLPWLRGQAPPRPWCKVVAALQGIVLLVAASGLLPEPVAVAALLVALALLVESFAHEAWDLWRVRQPHQPAALGHPADRPARVPGGLGASWSPPTRSAAVSPAAFARIPLEGLVLVGLVLLLPSRPAVWLATGAGLVLGVLTVLKLLDLGVSVAFARRFDPLGDPVYIGAGVSFLRDAMGTANAWTATVLAVVLMVAVLVLVPYAVLRATRLARGHRPVAVPVVLALSLVWVGCAVAGVRVAPGEPVAAATAVDLASTHVTEVRDRLRERAALAAQIADDDFADVPPSRLLRALRGKDVLLVFVESYGQVALEGLPTSSQLRDSVDADSRRLEAAGYRSRSAYLTSPTFGAMSWLAHSTLQSGLWIDNQGTYDLLLDRDRLTLSSAFGKAGWRSVGMIPADTEPWPEGQRFYRWEALHDLTNMDYEGPRFGYGRMPDQFALESFRRLELDRPGRGPGDGRDRPRVQPQPVGAAAPDGRPRRARRRLGLRRHARGGPAARRRLARRRPGQGGVRPLAPVLPRRPHLVRRAERG